VFWLDGWLLLNGWTQNALAVGGLSTGRGWWGVRMVPVVLLAVAVALTRVEADRDQVAVTA
jgi:hypothetical protein